MGTMTDEERGVFRYDVAGTVKGVVWLRCAVQAAFLTDAERKQWEVPEDASDDVTYVLKWTSQRYRNLYDKYRHLGDSAVDLREMWCLIVNFFHHGPKGWKEVIVDRPVDWDNLVDWRLLPDLRTCLDSLPHPKHYPPARQSPEDYWAEHGYAGWPICPHCKTPMYDPKDRERTFLGKPKQITVDNFELANSTPIGHGRVRRGEVICSSCAGEILIDLRNHNGLADAEAKSKMGW